jgi:hypothetical protein
MACNLNSYQGRHDRRDFLISAEKEAARLSVTVLTSLPGCYRVFACDEQTSLWQMPLVATITAGPSDGLGKILTA